MNSVYENLDKLTDEKLSNLRSVAKLLSIVEILRGEGGCNWDREQTFDTIKNTLVEECFETVDAILKKDYENLKEELGDLLLQIVFLSQMAKENNYFSMEDTAKSINEKLIHRHPHIFSESNAKSTKEILAQWEERKAKERKQKNKEGSILSSIPKSMPAMNKAIRLMEKASHVGFEYENVDDSLLKVKEEFDEVTEAFNNLVRDNNNTTNKEHLEEEVGDLIMTIIDFARMNKINADNALNIANEKFIRRFSYIEEKAKEEDKELTSLSLFEMDNLWKEAKKLEKK